ncbi:B-box zinc finger protein 20-like isoform X1 [Carica papaya]|uniref:B-box zinc finger protein 20-like isoform X1 n=1 Tax=Carica papaya TaxID=3649 RepID=UPI000B8CB3DA|nr:B-box zinc finger protein 20-like isoform X1 [Carica papaya]
MKIWCDMCDKEEASIFCSADEAALCDACDRRVHHANELARQHLRFSLVIPNLRESPLCDICQERRALLFCKEDRAILCRECDLPIHQANEHTQKHNRFLLTGVKLSASSSSSSSSLNPSSSCSNRSAATMGAEFNNFQSPMKRAQSTSSPCELFSSPSMAVAATNYTVHDYNKVMSDGGSIPTSSISEYLMETLPGWRVEDLLDPSAAFNCFSKTHDGDDTSTHRGEDFESNTMSYYFSSPEYLAVRVPQVKSNLHPIPQTSILCPQNGLVNWS